MSVEAGWKEQTISSLFDSSCAGEWGTDGTRDTGTPVLRSTNFRDDGSIDYSDVAYRTVPVNRLDARRISVGTILIEKAGGSSTRPAGRVVYCDREFGGTASNFVEVIKVGEELSPKYVFYLLYNNFHSGLVYKYQQQTTGIINFKLREYGSEVVSVPDSRLEQSKISEVLSTVDLAITQTEALIAKQQRIKTGLMQDLLTRGIDEHGQLRSEATHAFKDSALGRIPVEWEVKRIDDLVSRVGSGVTPTGGESVYTAEGVLFIRSQNVHFDGLRLDDVAYIPSHIHHSMMRSEVLENDVLLNITGASIGRCCRMPQIDVHANANQHVCTIRLRDVDESRAGFLTTVLQSHIGQHQIVQMNAGGNREGLNYQQVRSFHVPWPGDSSEFVRIYSHIERMNTTGVDHSLSLDKLRHLKTALMQDLLTGKVRVTPLLQPAEAASHG